MGNKLNGVVHTQTAGETSFWDGTLQSSLENKIAQELPSRPLLVRAHNQLKFSLFHSFNEIENIEGLDGQLFQRKFLKYSADFTPLSRDSIAQIASAIETWQRHLHSMNKKFVVMLSPAKTSFLGEFVPEGYENSSVTNTTRLVSAMKERNIPVIELLPGLRKAKDTTGLNIFAKYGTHWTSAGANFGFVEAVNQLNTRFPNLGYSAKVKSITPMKYYTESDAELWLVMNLLQEPPLPVENLAYVDTELDTTGEKPRILFVGDSFTWAWHARGFWQPITSGYYFAFYNNRMMKFGEGELGTNNPEMMKEVVDDVDFVILFSNESNLTYMIRRFIQFDEDLQIH